MGCLTSLLISEAFQGAVVAESIPAEGRLEPPSSGRGFSEQPVTPEPLTHSHNCLGDTEVRMCKETGGNGPCTLSETPLGAELRPPSSYVVALAPGPQNVTAFGDRHLKR